ncbi:MAG: pyridoxal phosphate-dependent aminotransferase, partial [Pyrinomonadaceae bacterium]
MEKTVSIDGLHGGRVYEAARRWNVAPHEVVDFSSNINPLGPPQRVLAKIKTGFAPINFRAYPDPHSFVMALAEKHRLMPDEIVVGSGVASLIFAVMHAVLPQRVAVLEPAFAEYARACAAVQATVTTWSLKEDDCFDPDFSALTRALDDGKFDLVILNSPHNPSGRLYARKDLLSLVDTAERSNVTVVLDEACIDYVPESSLLALAATKAHLIVLRSLTKFYAMPGLRVGYAVCGADQAKAIAMQVDPWSVSTIALEAARATLEEDDFDAQTRQINSGARGEFTTALQEARLHVFPSAANFLLARLPHGSGAELAIWLESERILIRRCDSFGGLTDRHIRLAVRSGQE